MVSGALKGAIFAANIYEKLGFEVVPNGSESRHDIIQAVAFHNPDALIAFCEGIQAAAPVGNYACQNHGQCRAMTAMSSWRQVLLYEGSSIGFECRRSVKPPCRLFPGRTDLVSQN